MLKNKMLRSLFDELPEQNMMLKDYGCGVAAGGCGGCGED